MRYPQVLLTFFKETNHSECRCAWANFNEKGIFTHMTGFYGEKLKLIRGNKITINNEIWVLRDHLNTKHRGQYEK